MAHTTEIVSANVQVTGLLDMRTNRITGLDLDLDFYPALPEDGASKKYVDFKKNEIVEALPVLVNNGTF
jgi:hypothetical protein